MVPLKGLDPKSAYCTEVTTRLCIPISTRAAEANSKALGPTGALAMALPTARLSILEKLEETLAPRACLPK